VNACEQTLAPELGHRAGTDIPGSSNFGEIYRSQGGLGLGFIIYEAVGCRSRLLTFLVIISGELSCVALLGGSRRALRVMFYGRRSREVTAMWIKNIIIIIPKGRERVIYHDTQ